MRTVLANIKNFFTWAWSGLGRAGRIVVGLVLITIATGAVYAAVKQNDENQNEDSSPEVAQVYEPSIGTPLPPDEPGKVDGAVTTESSEPQPADVMTAPEAGVDPNQPIKYKNDVLKFVATLPAGSEVGEKDDSVSFSSDTGQLHYIVSVSEADRETLQNLEAQLKNSPSVSNVSYTDFGDQRALKFNAKGYGTGLAFISNGKTYYLMGNSQYFANFKTI